MTALMMSSLSRLLRCCPVQDVDRLSDVAHRVAERITLVVDHGRKFGGIELRAERLHCRAGTAVVDRGDVCIPWSGGDWAAADRREHRRQTLAVRLMRNNFV